MKPLSLPELASILSGELSGVGAGAKAASDPPPTVTGFATDSRAVRPGDAFLAIAGSKVDGAEFANQALKRGASVVISERAIKGPTIRVQNLVVSLANLGRHYRDLYQGPVIGITGSAGKTTTKEFVAAALSPRGPVLKSFGNRNTEYTSPLLWPELEPSTASVVVEMAMRGFGQIAHLASFARPTAGVVTNIGFAHLLQVGSRRGIAQAKAELLEALPPEGLAVLWQGDLFLDFLRSRVPGARVRTFGYTDTATLQIKNYEPLDWGRSRIQGSYEGRSWSCSIPSVGRHIALNAAAALLVAAEHGVDIDAAAAAIESAELPPMRMETRELNGATLVLDTYNASPTSVVAAIETLRELPVSGRRLAVIGEMRELGEHTDEAHRMVGRALVNNKVDSVLFVGEAAEAAWDEILHLGVDPKMFQIADDLGTVTDFLRQVGSGDVVLVKGSRALELEKALVPLGVNL